MSQKDNIETETLDIYELAIENIREARIKFVSKLEAGVLKGDLHVIEAVDYFKKAYPNTGTTQAQLYLAAFGIENGPFKLRWANLDGMYKC